MKTLRPGVYAHGRRSVFRCTFAFSRALKVSLASALWKMVVVTEEHVSCSKAEDGNGKARDYRDAFCGLSRVYGDGRL
jgi:hypothetical protein